MYIISNIYVNFITVLLKTVLQSPIEYTITWDYDVFQNACK